MVKYNGYKNYNHWNVSLWINNDEGLYRVARNLTRRGNRDFAAKAMLIWLHDTGNYKTPDGVPYSLSSIRAAMIGM